MPSQKFVICKIIPKDKGFKHSYQKLTYCNIIDLINRFYTVKKYLEVKDGQGVEVNPSGIIKTLQYSNRLAKHGFIIEALQVILSSKIAPDAKQVIKKNTKYRNNGKPVILSKRKDHYIFRFNHHSVPVTAFRFDEMIKNIIRRLKDYLAGNIKTKPLHLNNHQQELIKVVEKIQRMKNNDKAVNSMIQFINHNNSYLDYKCGYSEYAKITRR